MPESAEPYAPPAAPTDPHAGQREPPNVFVLRASTVLLKIAVGLVVLSTPMCHAEMEGGFVLGLISLGLFGLSGLAAIMARGSIAVTPMSLHWIRSHPLPHWYAWIVGWIGSTIASSFFWPPFTRGRQIRRKGALLLAELSDARAWAKLPAPVLAEPHVRTGLAAQWRQNGRTEHASVAAFGKLSLDLIALGAPPRLLTDANNDALDEIRHAELCFSIARSLDGFAQGPAPFPELRQATPLSMKRSTALEQLAVDSLIEGVLLEGMSARVVARLLKQCEEPAIRATLKEIAADEGRHAAHSWDVVQWCIEQGGAPVIQALEQAAGHLPEGMGSEAPEEARAGKWEKYGIPGATLEAEEFAKARDNVVHRVRELSASRLAA